MMIFYFKGALGITLVIIGFLWLTMFILTIPSTTAHGSIKRALKENFQILKIHKKRVLKTSLIYFLLFQLPIFILIYIQNLLFESYSDSIANVLIFLIISITIMVITAIANPMMALITTRIYNTTEVGLNAKREIEKKNKEAEIVKIKKSF